MPSGGISRISPDKRAEVLRRAEIVRRYCTIESPTEEDDRNFAAELGLSTDSLFRLAAAWRRHGDIDALQGASVRLTSADRALALEVARGELDMSGVTPARRAETLRRIDVIRRYLEIPSPSRADRLASAKAMDLTPERFTRVLRAWLLHRSPEAIPGATVPRRQWRKKLKKRERLHELLDLAINRAGAGASVVRIRELFEEYCRDDGLKPPSQGTIYKWVRQLRSKTAQPSLETAKSPFSGA